MLRSAASRPSRRGVDRNANGMGQTKRESWSPLAQGRGSKHRHKPSEALRGRVAPRAGAWIETCSVSIVCLRMGSPLAQGRGSKQGSIGPRRLTPGPAHLHDAQGEPHPSTVFEKGYVWREATYPSLSIIARAITGTA